MQEKKRVTEQWISFNELAMVHEMIKVLLLQNVVNHLNLQIHSKQLQVSQFHTLTITCLIKSKSLTY